MKNILYDSKRENKFLKVPAYNTLPVTLTKISSFFLFFKGSQAISASVTCRARFVPLLGEFQDAKQKKRSMKIFKVHKVNVFERKS